MGDQRLGGPHFFDDLANVLFLPFDRLHDLEPGEIAHDIEHGFHLIYGFVINRHNYLRI